MQPLIALRNLLKVTGSIKTFYLDHKGAAYTMLQEVDLVTRGHELKTRTRHVITNKIVIQIPLDKSLHVSAKYSARLEGIIECNKIGALDDREAGTMIVRIAQSAQYRSKYRSAINRAIKGYKVYWQTVKAAMPDPRAPDTLGWRVWH